MIVNLYFDMIYVVVDVLVGIVIIVDFCGKCVVMGECFFGMWVDVNLIFVVVGLDES